MSLIRLLFMGTPDFAVPAFERICAAEGCEVVAVVCQPDRPSGRGLRNIEPAVKKAAVARGIPALQPLSLKEPAERARIELLCPDMVVVAAFGRKLPAWLLSLPALGCYNIHASILPRHRGAAPIARAILDGDSRTGITIFGMVGKMDAGPVLKVAELEILPGETAAELETRLAELGARVVVGAIELVRANSESRADASATAGQASSWRLTAAASKLFTEQDDSQATLAPKLSKEEGAIDWRQSAERIARMVRAFNPWPVATTSLQKKDGKTVKFGILRARVAANEPRSAQCDAWEGGTPTERVPIEAGASLGGRAGEAAPEPGTISAVSRNGILVATGNGTLLIEQVRPENRAEMAACAFVNGYRLAAGQRLGNT